MLTDAAAHHQARALAPGKINVFLGVGDLREDGYHDLRSVFQALDLYEDVTLTRTDSTQPSTIANRAGSAHFPGPSPVHQITIRGRFGTSEIPLDHRNLAVAAINALAARTGVYVPVDVDIDKQVPVAGGMGGGSADAAAALLAYAHLAGIDDAHLLRDIAAGLGADVPFALHGGTALGTGRGDELSPVMARGEYHWVLATSHNTLSTPLVYQTLDELRERGNAPAAELEPAAVLQALAAGDAHALAAAVHNDMTAAASALLPDVAEVLDSGRQAGALAALLSGSGPTVGFLAADATHALDLAVMLEASTAVKHVVRTTGPAAGAHLITP